MNIRRFDKSFHHWEHNMLMSGEKLVHQEAFWVGVAIAAMVAFFVLATIAGLKYPSPESIFPIPFHSIF
ncbi:MAG: hypothetical protein PHP01_09410 [Phycisphaerae bacterium]|nr:hypothetical protein [Phycisphaerae bacterium]